MKMASKMPALIPERKFCHGLVLPEESFIAAQQSKK
jgi:hypothetical protein